MTALAGPGGIIGGYSTRGSVYTQTARFVVHKLLDLSGWIALLLVTVPLHAQPTPQGRTYYKDPLLDPSVQKIMRDAQRAPAGPAPRWTTEHLDGHVCGPRRADSAGNLLRDRRVLDDGSVEELEYKPAGKLIRVVRHGSKGTLEVARYCGPQCGERAQALIISNGWPTPWAGALMASVLNPEIFGPYGAKRTKAATPPTSAPAAAGRAKTYDYDSMGNVTADSDGNQYEYNSQHRLATVRKPNGAVVAHVYDDFGNRVQTTTTLPGQPPQVTNFLVDTSGALSHVVAESDGDGNLKALYVRGGDELLSVMRPRSASASGWTTRFVHADGLGSIRRLTDEDGNFTDSWSYSAFGETSSTSRRPCTPIPMRATTPPIARTRPASSSTSVASRPRSPSSIPCKASRCCNCAIHSCSPASSSSIDL